MSDQELAEGLERAMENNAVARGVTQVHDMGGVEDFRILDLYRRTRAERQAAHAHLFVRADGRATAGN